jgi:hypothetical protein
MEPQNWNEDFERCHGGGPCFDQGIIPQTGSTCTMVFCFRILESNERFERGNDGQSESYKHATPYNEVEGRLGKRRVNRVLLLILIWDLVISFFLCY